MKTQYSLLLWMMSCSSNLISSVNPTDLISFQPVINQIRENSEELEMTKIQIIKLKKSSSDSDQTSQEEERHSTSSTLTPRVEEVLSEGDDSSVPSLQPESPQGRDLLTALQQTPTNRQLSMPRSREWARRNSTKEIVNAFGQELTQLGQNLAADRELNFSLEKDATNPDGSNTRLNININIQKNSSRTSEISKPMKMSVPAGQSLYGNQRSNVAIQTMETFPSLVIPTDGLPLNGEYAQSTPMLCPQLNPSPRRNTQFDGRRPVSHAACSGPACASNDVVRRQSIVRGLSQGPFNFGASSEEKRVNPVTTFMNIDNGESSSQLNRVRMRASLPGELNVEPSFMFSPLAQNGNDTSDVGNIQRPTVLLNSRLPNERDLSTTSAVSLSVNNFNPMKNFQSEFSLLWRYNSIFGDGCDLGDVHIPTDAIELTTASLFLCGGMGTLSSVIRHGQMERNTFGISHVGIILISNIQEIQALLDDCFLHGGLYSNDNGRKYYDSMKRSLQHLGKHVERLQPEAFCLHSTGHSGVHIDPLQMLLPKYHGNIFIRKRQVWCDFQNLRDVLIREIGKDYNANVLELKNAAKGKNKKKENPDTAFCSEAVALIFQELGLLPRDILASNYTPASFCSQGGALHDQYFSEEIALKTIFNYATGSCCAIS